MHRTDHECLFRPGGVRTHVCVRMCAEDETCPLLVPVSLSVTSGSGDATCVPYPTRQTGGSDRRLKRDETSFCTVTFHIAP